MGGEFQSFVDVEPEIMEFTEQIVIVRVIQLFLDLVFEIVAGHYLKEQFLLTGCLLQPHLLQALARHLSVLTANLYKAYHLLDQEARIHHATLESSEVGIKTTKEGDLFLDQELVDVAKTCLPQVYLAYCLDLETYS